MTDPNQIIQDLRHQVAELTTRCSILERDVQEESKCKYAAYKRIEELKHELQDLQSSLRDSE